MENVSSVSSRPLVGRPKEKEVMKVNGIAPLDLQGEEFQQFVSESVTRIQDISRKIGIIK